jgi:hypothetical protein
VMMQKFEISMMGELTYFLGFYRRVNIFGRVADCTRPDS